MKKFILILVALFIVGAFIKKESHIILVNNCFPVYEVKMNSIEHVYDYVPQIVNGEILSVTIRDVESNFVQESPSLAVEMKQYMVEKRCYAVLWDASHAYLYDGDNLYLLHEFSIAEGRQLILKNFDFSKVSLSRYVCED